MAAEDEEVGMEGAFEAFVGMLPQTGKYASLLQQRLAEAQGEEEEEDEDNSSADGSSQQSDSDEGSADELAGNEDDDISSLDDESLAEDAESLHADDEDDAAEDELNSAEHTADVFQRLYWGVGAEGDDDPEEDDLIKELEAAKQLETRAIPLSAEQLGLGDTPEGHQTPFMQITAKLPTLPDASTAPFMQNTSSGAASASSRKRRRSSPAADSAVTCVDLSAAYNVGAKTAHQFALYHADRRLALKRAGEAVTDASLAGFDERLVVRQGEDAKLARRAAFDEAVAAAQGAAAPHALQPRTPSSALLSPLQRLLLDNAHDYRDMVLPVEHPGNMTQLRTALALHVASHLQRARNRVIKHDSKLRSAAAARRVKKLATAVDSVQPDAHGGDAKPLGDGDAQDAGQGAADDVQEEELDPDALRDQGFARCRVVVLLPFKHMALQFVRCLLTLLGQGRTVHHRKRFMEEFGDEEAKRGEPAHVQNTVGEGDWVQDDFSSERIGAAAAAAAAKKARKGKNKPPPKRPAEHNQQFMGDVDDSFRVGLSIAKNSIRLYSSFYVSDIIIASPMGLRMTTGAEGEADREVDFLSSVEMLVMLHANTLEMQNWEHVREVVGAMNQLPTKPRDTDFSRVRMWNLAGLSRFRRQTIVCCEHSTPDIAAFAREHMHNARGRMLLHWQYSGSLGCVIPSVKQVWHRLDVRKAGKVMEKRCKYLARHVVPQLQAGATEDMPSQPHTLVVTPTYFEFVKLRNMMEKSGMDFAPISEYSSQQDVSRARTLLFQGRVPQMLITERFHFFNRYKLRGIRHIVFAGIPVHGRYYSEFVNFLEEASQSHATSVLVLFTRYEAAALERVVGTARVARLLSTEGKSTFVFC